MEVTTEITCLDFIQSVNFLLIRHFRNRYFPCVTVARNRHVKPGPFAQPQSRGLNVGGSTVREFCHIAG